MEIIKKYCFYEGVTVMDKKDKRRIIIYLIFILLFVIRLYKIASPPLDYSSWRQVDTDSIARNFVEYRFNIFFPQLNYDGPMPNYVQLEFQITTFIIAMLYKIFGYNPVLGRIVPVAFFMGSCYYLYRLVKNRSGMNVAGFSVLFYGLLPINVIYSRNIMPESALMFFLIGAVCYFAEWIDRCRTVDYVMAVVFTALAVLTKIPAALMGIPMICLSIEKYGLQVFRNKRLYLFPVIVLGIPLLYFRWLEGVAEQKFVSGIGSTMILPNFLNSIFRKETVKYLTEQFALKVFTVPGTILFAAGVVMKKRKEEYFYYSWLLAAILHVIFVDAVIHLDYYLMIITPVICIFMGQPAAELMRNKRYQYFFYLALLVIIFNNATFLKQTYRVQDHYITLGSYVSMYTEKNDLIIIDRDSPELLYTSNRKGWRLYGDLLTVENIKELEEEGAVYFVSSRTDTNMDAVKYLDDNYPKINLPDGSTIYKLSQ